MPLRRPKSVTTDYRPPAASSWDIYTALNAKDASEHDKAVQGLGMETLEAIVADLGARGAYDRRDHEHRWIMGRLGAGLRRLIKLGWKGNR